MWSSKAFAGIVLGLSLLLAGCGFQPLYGQHQAAVGNDLAAVRVLPIEGRPGQTLRNHLIDATAGADVPKLYELKVILDKAQTTQLLRRDDTASRAETTLTARYELIFLGDGTQKGKRLLTDNATARAAYNMFDGQYASVVAERDSEDRAARMLAEQIRQAVAVVLARRNGRGE